MSSGVAVLLIPRACMSVNAVWVWARLVYTEVSATSAFVSTDVNTVQMVLTLESQLWKGLR